MIYPYLVELGMIVPKLDYLSFGVLNFLSAVITFAFLPETKDKNLPESIEDTVKLIKQSLFFSLFTKN